MFRLKFIITRVQSWLFLDFRRTLVRSMRRF